MPFSRRLFFDGVKLLSSELQLNPANEMLLVIYWDSHDLWYSRHGTVWTNVLSTMRDEAIKRFWNLPQSEGERHLRDVYPPEILNDKKAEIFFDWISLTAEEVFKAELKEGPPHEHFIFGAYFDGDKVLSLPIGDMDDDGSMLDDVIDDIVNSRENKSQKEKG